MSQAPTINTDTRSRREPCRLCLAAALALFALAPITPAVAQAATEGQPAAGTVFTAEDAAEVKTLKEKLSDKASDEQRVDNCRVPPDRRGTTPRPDCPPGRITAVETAGSDR